MIHLSHRLPRLLAVALLAAVPAVVLVPRLCAVARAEAPAAAQQGPQELMETVSRQLFEALDANRAAIKKDPEKAFPIVDTILLPHFDTDYAAQLVLAQNWRTATPEQRKRFVAALYRALLKTYGGAIGDFTADRLKLLPFKGDPAATQATVHTVVTRSAGTTVEVDYRLRKTADGWKAWDVVIEGISYVKNYRTDLGAEISAKGLEAVIARLEHEGLAVHIASDKPAGEQPAAAAGRH
ncbi:MAG TPA: ABC transporter substrate-binding protein [Steroidobacteraceae bacterium]|nr:ABC transporter substrate-binding protein [Steroidobacteraceae bacterium]